MSLVDDIYAQYEGSGFKFEYKNGRLGKSVVVFRDEVETIPDCKRNEDDIALFVRCGSCDDYMDFENGNWVCPHCGKKVREMTVYKQLDRENEREIKKFT